MNTLYHWLGFGVFWLMAGTVFVVGGYHIEKRIVKRDWWLWIQTHIFRRPLQLSRRGMEGILYMQQRGWAKKLPRWKRNLAAYTIRYNRRIGFQED
jgi:hypothetical protein